MSRVTTRTKKLQRHKKRLDKKHGKGPAGISHTRPFEVIERADKETLSEPELTAEELAPIYEEYKTLPSVTERVVFLRKVEADYRLRFDPLDIVACCVNEILAAEPADTPLRAELDMTDHCVEEIIHRIRATPYIVYEDLMLPVLIVEATDMNADELRAELDQRGYIELLKDAERRRRAASFRLFGHDMRAGRVTLSDLLEHS